ncbi:MAG: DinB family protein [Thermoanaerobaculia bacterium]|nr:DinB family protein [Thermoanaerobaculia bacterium]
MRRTPLAVTLSTIVMLLLCAPAYAGEHEMSGLRSELMGELDQIEKKLVGLAEAIPAEKYDWRPAEGIRSVSETLMHVAGGNYYFLQPLGLEGPEGLDPRTLEKNVTEKDDVISELKRSFKYARKAVKSVGDDHLEDMVEVFGSDWTKRQVLLLYVTHGHEHLGQMIAYARSNEVTPPWSS